MTPQRVGTLTSATKRSAVLGIIGGVITRTHVLAEIKRTAAENGGKPLGFRRFEAETGIRETDWLGKHWARWNDAVTEAGLEPNLLKSRLDDDGVLAAVAIEVRRLGRFPAEMTCGWNVGPTQPHQVRTFSSATAPRPRWSCAWQISATRGLASTTTCG